MFFFKSKKPEPIVFIGSRWGFNLLIEICELRDIPVLGFLDRFYYGNTDQIKGVPCIGSELDLYNNPKKYKDAKFFLGNGWDGNSQLEKNPMENGFHLRLERLALIKQLNLSCHNLIDPSVRIGKDSVIGQGVHLGRWVSVRDGVHIADHCAALDMAIFGEDVRLGENTYVSAKGFVAGGITVGENVYIGTNATLVSANPNEPMHIGDNVKIHAHALVHRSMAPNTTATFTGKMLRRQDLEEDN